MYLLKLISKRTIALLILLLCFFITRSQLVANFTIDKPGGCAPLAITIKNTSTGVSPTAVYSWDLGNGNLSSLKEPAAIYTEEKTFTITLTIKDGSNTSSISKEVFVYKQPTADFNASIIKGCLPLNVNFTSNSTPGDGTISTYHWDFGDGAVNESSTGSSLHTYNDPKKATVSLTVTNNHGCYATVKKEKLIEILPELVAEFSADKSFLCKIDETVKLINQSSGPGALNYHWDFGNSASSTEKDPGIIFNKKGIFSVKLMVTSSEGCTVTQTKTNYLNVSEYKTDITAPPLICENTNATFINNSQPQPIERTWLIDDQVYYNYTNQLDYYFNSAGSHKIKLVNRFGNCIDSAVKTVVVEAAPDIKPFEIILKDSCGSPATIAFKDTTAGAVKWEWDLNYEYYPTGIESTNQAGTFTYKANGYYRPLLKVYNAKGCSRETQQYISISPPVASINAYNPDYYYKYADCDSLVFSFSTYSTQEIATYKWDFGDGTISTDAKPTHTFKKKGIFIVNLEFTTTNGCKGSAAHYNSFKILDRPKADFYSLSGDTICGNNPVLLQHRITGNYYDSYWMVNNSYAGNYNSDLAYLMQDTGYYKVQLVAINEGCRDTSTKENFIYKLPSFPKITGYQHTCEGTRGEVTFTQSSKYAKKWTWNFGDGQIVEYGNDTGTVKHTYARSGHYKIVLTTTNGTCTNSDSIYIYVLTKQSPNLTSGITEICKDSPWPFTISNMDQIPYLNYYYGYYHLAKWEYGDGTNFQGYYYGIFESSPFKGELKNFQTGKDKIRAITVSYPFGCYDTSNYVPLKIKGVNADFNIEENELCFNSPAKFTDVSSVSPGNSISARSWSFGDGSTASTTNNFIQHSYSSPGSFPVVLTVTDNTGCTSSTSSYAKFIVVNGPKASFTCSSTNVPIKSVIYFYNNTNFFNANSTTYYWDFGDGKNSNEIQPSHVFDKPGTYTVKLTAVDAVKNCRSEFSQAITVTNFNAAFSMTSIKITKTSCPPVLVQFINTSQNAIKIKWDFGDGITSANVHNPGHIYEKPGKYIISLFVTGPNGLEEIYYDSVEIKMPSAKLFTDKNEICKDDQVKLSIESDQTISSVFDFGDGSVQHVSEGSSTHQYVTSGKFLPGVLITDAAGCSSTATFTGNIIVRNPPDVNIIPAAPLICEGSSVQLNASGGIRYLWSSPGGLNNTTIANPVASPNKTADFTVKVADNIGCMKEETVRVTVVNPFKMNVSQVPAICEGEQAQLLVQGADKYKWIEEVSTLNSSAVANPIARPLRTTSYIVTGFDRYGCFSDTGVITVKVNKNPLVNAGNDIEVLSGNPVQLMAEGSNDIISWNWTPGRYLDCTACPNPISTTPVDNSYTITVKNANGCVASDEVMVKILCEEKRIGIPNAFTPNGDGKNDVFTLQGVSVIDRIIIFNRWGQKVYERTQLDPSDIGSCWNGTMNGHPVPSGSYIYYIEMKCPSGGAFVKRGNITVVR